MSQIKKLIVNNPLKIYAVLVSICTIIVSFAFVFLFHRTHYDTLLLIKLGLKDEPPKIDHAVVGWNNMLKKLNYDADIVFFGDSITKESDFRAYFDNVKIVNSGYPGDNLKGMINRIPGISAVKPQKIFILGGINSLYTDSISDCISAYKTLLEELIKESPDTEIYIQSVLPISFESETEVCSNATIIEFNNQLKQLTKNYDVTYIDLYSLYELNGEINPALTTDGVHLSPDSYALWADAIEEYVN